MADKKISQLTSATTPLAGTEVLPIVQSSTTVKVSAADVTAGRAVSALTYTSTATTGTAPLTVASTTEVANLRAANATSADTANAVKSNATTGVMQIAGPAAAATRVMTIPDANFTAARTDAAQTFSGDQTFSNNPILSAGTVNGVAYVDGLNKLATSSAVTYNGTAFIIGTLSGGTLALEVTKAGVNDLAIFATTSGGGGRILLGDGNTSVNPRIGASGNSFKIWTNTTGTVADRFTIEGGGNLVCGGVYDATVGGTNRDVFVDNTGLVGYVSSIRASKVNIDEFNDVSWLLQLKPVSFNYRKKDAEGNYTDIADGVTEYGLIAEDVEPVNADLCFYDEVDGKQELRGISYSKLVTPMLKLIQQQQSAIEKLEAKVAVLEGK